MMGRFVRGRKADMAGAWDTEDCIELITKGSSGPRRDFLVLLDADQLKIM